MGITPGFLYHCAEPERPVNRFRSRAHDTWVMAGPREGGQSYRDVFTAGPLGCPPFP